MLELVGNKDFIFIQDDMSFLFSVLICLVYGKGEICRKEYILGTLSISFNLYV